MNFGALLSIEGAISFVSLAAMEIVLGIDNIVFIAIISQKVAKDRQRQVRRLGIALALVMRLGLLFTLSWIMRLTQPLFGLFGHELSGRDLVLLVGGLFLVAKSTHEIHDKVEAGHAEDGSPIGGHTSFASTLVQILLLDIVFSLDSVITAVGMSPHLEIMVAAMISAVVVMLVFADRVSDFIGRHPSMKVLALSFLLLIGTLLVAEGFDRTINKGYIYFAMGFSLAVEMLNIRMRRPRARPAVPQERFEVTTNPERIPAPRMPDPES